MQGAPGLFIHLIRNLSKYPMEVAVQQLSVHPVFVDVRVKLSIEAAPEDRRQVGDWRLVRVLVLIELGLHFRIAPENFLYFSFGQPVPGKPDVSQAGNGDGVAVLIPYSLDDIAGKFLDIGRQIRSGVPGCKFSGYRRSQHQPERQAA